MYADDIKKVAESAKNKSDFIGGNLTKYIVLAMMSGFFIIIGVALSFSVASITQVEGKFYGKIAIGLTFWMALGLLASAGGELFTGNCFVFTVGCLERTVSLIKVSWVRTKLFF
ncbi:MAG: formate/nitrite transporter family protein [Paenibacillaceae bacterium]|nr:formate/nitrite transporter family protein [Paenibacillaceae bacterium]